jgi:hypothetical protein
MQILTKAQSQSISRGIWYSLKIFNLKLECLKIFLLENLFRQIVFTACRLLDVVEQAAAHHRDDPKVDLRVRDVPTQEWFR